MALCPNCSKNAAKDTAPFCSKRCREVDLNRWLTGSYAVPAVELDDVDIEAMEEALNSEERE